MLKKQNKNIIFTVAFIAVWCALIVSNLLIPEKAFSDNENRSLSAMPEFSIDSLLDGSYMGDIDTYVNDQFVLRDEWISIMGYSEYLLGKRESNGVLIGDNALFTRVSPSDDYTRKNVEGINSFAQNSGLDCYFALIPSAAEIQSEKLPVFAQISDEQGLINDAYSDMENVVCADIYGALNAHDDEYIYYRTDHHWTTYGAYLAYTELCGRMGITPAPYNVIQISDSFFGTLYSRSGVRFVEKDTMEAFIPDGNPTLTVGYGENVVEYPSIFFDDYLNKKDKYSYFLGTNQPVETLYSGRENGKKLLLFRDSYSSCLAPMLLSEYDEIALIDMRYINIDLGEIIDTSDYDNALFLFSTDVFANQRITSKLI